MGQGLYRMLGWGCLNPPDFDWDNHPSLLYDVVRMSYEAESYYLMIPMAIDDEWLQKAWNLPPLPKGGLPHIEPRTAQVVPRCEWWPDVEKTGVWVSGRIVQTWEMFRQLAKVRGIELPDGQPIFVCDWD